MFFEWYGIMEKRKLVAETVTPFPATNYLLLILDVGFFQTKAFLLVHHFQHKTEKQGGDT